MRFKAPVLIIASSIVIAACTGGERPATSAAVGGTLIVTAPSDAMNVFPPFVADQVGRWVQDLLFDHLAEIKQDMVTVGDAGFEPRLAQKWTWANDSLSIAFTLDPRARWHDGQRVTAADVRYSFKIFTDPKIGSPTAELLSNIDSVSVRDTATAVVWFKKRKPEQFYDVAYQLVIFPEHVYGSIPPEQLHTSELMRHPVGSGRFKLDKWDAGTRIVLVSDTANWRGRAKLDRVVFTPLEPAAAAVQVVTGQADYMDSYPLDRLAALDSSTVARATVLRLNSYGLMEMNRFAPKSKTVLHPIFSDKRVRRALSMAVDRVAELHNVFGDNGRLSHGPFPMTLAVGDSTTRVPPYDTSAANALLDSAGWHRGADGIRLKSGRPLRFTLLAPTSSLTRLRYSVLLQAAFQRVGAQADVEQIDPGTMQERLARGDFDAAVVAINTDPSPSGTAQFWSTSGIGANGQNFSRYSNPVVDARIDSITATNDVAASKAVASRAFQSIIDDVPAIWLYDMVVVDAVNRRVVTAALRPDEWWANIADWWIPVDKRIDRDRIGLTPTKP